MGELYCGDFAPDSGQLCGCLVNCYADCDGHLVTQTRTEENNHLLVMRLTMLSPMGQYLYTMSTMVRGINVVAIRRSVRARLAIRTFRVVSRTLAE